MGINTDMMTFMEFLHGDDWTRPLLPDLNKAMRKIVRSGQATGTVDSTTTFPPHQHLLLLLSRVGARGLSRAEISKLVDLDRDTLNDLLAALVGSAEIAVSQTSDGRRVYRLL